MNKLLVLHLQVAIRAIEIAVLRSVELDARDRLFSWCFCTFVKGYSSSAIAPSLSYSVETDELSW